jgi:hypothetical protein
MEASFVHLNVPLEDEFSVRKNSVCSEWTRQTEKWTHESPQSCCWDCLSRLQQALEKDTERLEYEANVYINHAQASRLRQKQWQQKVDGDLTREQLVQQAKESYMREIDEITLACEQLEAEFNDLKLVRRELSAKADELDHATEEIFRARNDIELAAAIIEQDQENLYRAVASAHKQVDRLSSTRIQLYSQSYDLQVDQERGLRYPLINKHRLAYRPKGDVQWEEIQTAWSLAAQLLLVLASAFQFQSRHWRIVPLTDCAKLIFYPPTQDQKTAQNPISYNLGHPETHNGRALLAWNALLHSVASWVLTRGTSGGTSGTQQKQEPRCIPFEMTRNSIGDKQISSLLDNDDSGWSIVIHRMSCNLLWLAQCANDQILDQVILKATMSTSKLTRINDTPNNLQ